MPNAEPGGPENPEALPADSAVFELLGNDIRLRIVCQLRATEPGCPMAFSRLRERVGVGDSGKFNYHLGRLQGTLVVKRQDGYALTPAGRAVAELLDAEGDEEARSR